VPCWLPRSRRQPDEDLIDPRGRGHVLFQQMDAPRPSATGSTSTSGCRTTRPRRALQWPSPPAVAYLDEHAPSWWVPAAGRGQRSRRVHLDEPRLSKSLPATVSPATPPEHAATRALACGMPTLILTVIPQATTEPNQTALTINAAQPDLARPDWTVREQKIGSYLLNSRLQVRVLPGAPTSIVAGQMG
jgi:hypothetical protein